MESYIFNFNEYQDLNLLEIGDQQCTPLYSFGPYIRNEYIFHYVLSGKGYISYAPSTCSDNKILADISGSIEIDAGEGFLLSHTANTYIMRMRRNRGITSGFSSRGYAFPSTCVPAD
ncbi:hypothetical protein LC724_36035 [Blautia sp. RD014234]|nr:hypothetical protein [Blautia parvula]